MVDRGDYVPEEHCKGKGKRATGSDKKTEPSKLLALMTNLISTKKGGSGDNNNGKRGRDEALESFRYDKKGETAMFNNKTWWWCLKHKNSNDEMTGMYVRHRPSDHDVWQKDKKAYSTKLLEEEKATTKGDSSTQGQNKKLVMDDSFKAALLTMIELSEDQINEFETKWEDFC